MTSGAPRTRRLGGLLEREREVAALESLIGAAAAGEAAVAFVEGSAGIGKSRLIAAARDRAAESGFRTLSARGTELEREFPFGVVRQLFEPLRIDSDAWERWLGESAAAARTVFEAPPEAADEALRDASFGALHGLYWLTVNLTGDAPLLLAVDDLHWCDRPSLRFLAYLAPRLEGLPVLLVAGARTADPGTDPALIAALAGSPLAVTIDPGPLSSEAVTSLIADRLGAEPDPGFAAACLDATGGNPLLLGQLISSLDAEGVRPEADQVEVVRAIGPRAVSRTVLLRLSRLDAGAVATAHAVAILGEDAELPVVASLAGFDESTAAAATAKLARADILRLDAPLGFAHPLVREAIYRDIAPAERELRHARAAKLLADAGAPADRIASHLLVVPRRGDRWAVNVLRDAALSALRRGASDSAVAYLRRALDEPAPEDLRYGLLYDLGLAEIATSGVAGLPHLQASHAGISDPRKRAMVAYQIAFVQVFTNAPDRAAVTLRSALAELPAEMHEERMLLEALSLTLCWFGVSDTRELERLAAYRHDPPDGGPGAKYLTAITAFDWMLRNGARDACADLALGAIADGTLVEIDTGISPVATACILTFAERPEIVGLWDGWLEEAHRRGAAHGVLTVHVWRAVTLMAHDELVDAERSVEAGLEGHRLWGATVRAGSAQAWGVLAWTLLEQGRLAEARAALEQEAREPVLTYGGIFWRRPKAELLLAERDFEAAVVAADDLVVDWVTNPAVVPWRTIKAQALAALGDADQAVELATEELALAREWGAPGPIGRALRVLGTARGDDGVEDLREAVEVLETSTARLERAKALFALGSTMRRARKPTESRDPLRRALELATACGAAGLAANARAELAASGARPRSTALGGVESLTASERRVTALAADGRTNRDIAQELYVTPKTVEVHLSNAYRKLAIKSRRELAGALASED